MRLILLICFGLLSLSSLGQPNFIKRLQAGKPQHIVVYGTSLSSGNNGEAWMHIVAETISNQYGANLFSYSLAGKGGMWSTWGVQHLEDNVIAEKPDAVFIEFGINDAFLEHETSVAVARLNLLYMIDRIRLYNDSCDIVLQVMNMPIGKSASLRPHLDAYYTMYREVAKEKNALLVDHYASWQKILNQGEGVFLQYVPDGIHPNTMGGEEIIAPFILKTLGLRSNEDGEL
ncbi:SGNH/GDSL hydrolase family protein [Olivibacter sp. SDN3]|uniref:SGNH/GDSL hydrolase family protein n=1 Tax=Olivibacter sp. SDN3 TaxID=2764720 RepID=UPI001651AB8D|nr:SGNH/GDSL hydrolase family protein [Olivibacter sp. SDN3]QNL51065.1 SGNH/GDSL hydrolase family protein [Olivibacter sp. SDN3]